jgi:hypothetical protein
MPLIVFSGIELHPRSPGCSIPEAICVPVRSVKSPRRLSQRVSELENLLRNAVRLRDAQKRAAETRAEESKGNSKARDS